MTSQEKTEKQLENMEILIKVSNLIHKISIWYVSTGIFLETQSITQNLPSVRQTRYSGFEPNEKISMKS